ncbi:MAG: DUF6370 family protein [Verrucomicrobiota bacterium]
MKRTASILVMAGLLMASLSAFAADKEITITGEGKCAKCALKESDKCQNVIQTTENGKKVTYYLVQNQVSKDFHENLCKESEKVTATGTVKEEHGKMMLTASKIEAAK